MEREDRKKNEKSERSEKREKREKEEEEEGEGEGEEKREEREKREKSEKREKRQKREKRGRMKESAQSIRIGVKQRKLSGLCSNSDGCTSTLRNQYHKWRSRVSDVKPFRLRVRIIQLNICFFIRGRGKGKVK
jgi:hypothetical protein